MWTKPHYRQIRADEVNFGDKIYSKLLDETFCITTISKDVYTVELTEGCYTLRCSRSRMLWKEVKPKCLR